MKGKIKWFNNEKGYGFIEYKTNKDIYVHYTSIIDDGYKSLIKDEIVEFTPVETEKGIRAKNVKSVTKKELNR